MRAAPRSARPALRLGAPRRPRHRPFNARRADLGGRLLRRPDRRGADLERRADAGADPERDEHRDPVADVRPPRPLGLERSTGTTTANTIGSATGVNGTLQGGATWAGQAPAVALAPRRGPSASSLTARTMASPSGTGLRVPSRCDRVHARAVVQATGGNREPRFDRDRRHPRPSHSSRRAVPSLTAPPRYELLHRHQPRRPAHSPPTSRTSGSPPTTIRSTASRRSR